ncbi:MAG: hypothetical protein M1282_01810 [Chloroflexi bacterium]|nr:hypothetical protein [Chloroflexota bacterium]
MRAANDFVLGIPYLFLKKIPYGWIGVVVLWAWPPIISGILVAFIVIGLLLMKWQKLAWEASIRQNHHEPDGVFFVDHPHSPRLWQVRNLIILFAISALLGWLSAKLIGLSELQMILLFAGFTLLYKDALLLGASTTYIVTEDGIGIHYIPGQIDYRIFLAFDEISQIRCGQPGSQIPDHVDILAPQKQITAGLLLVPKNPNGFSKTLEKVLISPSQPDIFLSHIPPRVAVRRTDLMENSMRP